MADDKTARGTLVDSGCTVTVSQETADLLGSGFEPEKSTSKSSTSKSSSSSSK